MEEAMIKNRPELNILCNTCPVSASCIGSDIAAEETAKINTLIKKRSVIDIGEHIYYQNDKMKNIFALYSGACKEYSLDIDGNEKIKNFYFPGDILALESMSTKKHLFSLLALQKSQLCVIPCEELFLLMQESPTLLRRFTYIISYRIQQGNDIPMTTNSKQRIAAFLMNVYDRLQTSQIETEKNSFSLPMSQFDIANFLGLAHETISRIFHLFQKEALIKISNKQINLTNIDFLRSLAQNGEFFTTSKAVS